MYPASDLPVVVRKTRLARMSSNANVIRNRSQTYDCDRILESVREHFTYDIAADHY
jgi:tryptophanase